MVPALHKQVEVFALPGWGGAVDVFLPQHNLALMVDGEGHFLKHTSSQVNRAAAQQVITDNIFNSKVLLQPADAALKGVVRLHYLDREYWWWHITRAIIASTMQSGHFALFSKSYGYMDLCLG
jgi:hypothetical protein